MDKYLEDLAELLLKIKRKKDMEEFLNGLLTPQERKDIPKRVQIIRMLKKEVSQRIIAKKLGVGIATITRGSIELKLKHFKNIT